VTLRAQKPLSPAYPATLITLGDHLRKRRLDLKLLQRDVAREIGVDKTTIHNWETNKTKPDLYIIPKLIEFIGYSPLYISIKGIGEQIKVYRKVLGITQKCLAKQLGIDPTTLAKWERGKGRPSKGFLEEVSRLFASFSPGTSDPGK
jgi:transcriptional regulator with XRE-family HTH domain